MRKRTPPLPIVTSARAWAGAVCGIVAAAGAITGAVRILPWLLDPEVPWRVAAPFARGLAALALETALVVGWPVGWALGCARAVETGEARVLQSLGESPAVTMRRLAAQGATLALILGVVAWLAGRDANAPGRTATELLSAGRASCVRAAAPTTYVVPFTSLAWLCAPGAEPRLAGPAPGALARAWVTARGARIAGDFRALELDDARLVLPGDPAVALHVAQLSVRGMPPWSQASALPPWWRALLLVLSAAVSSAAASLGVLRGEASGRGVAVALGALGPIAALGLLRGLERLGAPPWCLVVVPVAAWALVALASAVLQRWKELAWRPRAGARACE